MSWEVLTSHGVPQVQQVVGSIQKTNDLAVHIALIKCPSYYRKVREKYYRDPHSIEEELRDYVNTFGMMQVLILTAEYLPALIIHLA